jgi:lincosamide nucleotidyltransferase A/C/D/E
MHKEMTATDVIKFNIDLEKSGIAIWIDGGWGVDALLGKQTRLHADLDIAIEQKYLKKAVGLLEKQGYQNVPHDDTCPWNFVLGDNKGRGHQKGTGQPAQYHRPGSACVRRAG